MGSPLWSSLFYAIIFYFENMWLENCPPRFKPIVYGRFFGNTFLLFLWSKDHVEKFRDHLNKKQKCFCGYTLQDACTSLGFLFQPLVSPNWSNPRHVAVDLNPK